MKLRALFVSFSVLATVLVAGAQAQAPDPRRVAAAKEMLVHIGAVRQFDEAMPLIFSQMTKSFVAVAPDKAKEIREVFDKLLPRFMARKSELTDQIAELYAAELTQQEIEAVIAFYKSPVGAKFASTQPKILRQSVALGQRWGEKLGREIEQEARQELKKKGVDM
jgi:hypothetical protein